MAEPTFFNPWEEPPQFTPGPSDPALGQRILKLAQYAVKNGPSFVELIKSKQANNADYAFLFPNSPGSDYYRWVLYCTMYNHPVDQALPGREAPAAPAGAGAAPPAASTAPAAAGQGPATAPAAAPAQPDQAAVQSAAQEAQLQQAVASLSAEVATGFDQVLAMLSGSKESISSSRSWFMACQPYAAGMAAKMALFARGVPDYDRQLHVLYLANDILFKGLSQRQPGSGPEADPVAQAFLPALSVLLRAAYVTGGGSQEVHDRLTKILSFWGEKGIFQQSHLDDMRRSMLGSAAQAAPAAAGPSSSQPAAAVGAPHGAPPSSLHSQPWAQGSAHGQAPAPAHLQAVPPAGQYPPPAGMAGGPSQWPVPHGLAPAHYPAPAAVPPGAVPGALYGQPGPSMAQPVWYPPPPGSGGVPSPQAPPPLAPAPGAYPHAALSYPPPGMPPQPVAPAAVPVDSMGFPPAQLPDLVRRKHETDAPYSPLSPLDIERIGLPAPTQPDAYLQSRLDRFYAELQDFRPGMTRANDEDERQRHRRFAADNEGLPRVIPRRSDPSGMSADGSFPTGGLGSGAGSGKGGLGFRPEPVANVGAGSGSSVDDPYDHYRTQRSSVYRDTMMRSAAAAGVRPG